MSLAAYSQPVGPPVHQVGTAKPVTPVSSDSADRQSVPLPDIATVTAVSGDHVAILEELRTRVDELDALTKVVGQLEARRSELVANSHPDDPAEVVALWTDAIHAIDRVLGLHLQLDAGSPPTILAQAVATFGHWSETFRSNAVGPGGEAFSDSLPRLEKFLARLVELDPPASELLGIALAVRDDQALLPTELATRAKVLVARAAASMQRVAAVTTATQSLKTDYGPRLVALHGRIDSFRSTLTHLANRPDSSAQLTEQAREGLRFLDETSLDQLESTLTSLHEWVAKYQAYPSFTPALATDRISHDLATPLAALEEQLTQLEKQYSPEDLLVAEAARQESQVATLRTQVEQQLQAVKDRYQALVAVRRRKLGSEEDDRYFGTVAKVVNDAVATLAEAENGLLDLQSQLRDADPIRLQALRAQITEATTDTRALLAQSDRFADEAHLEATLQQAWQAELEALLRPSQAAEHRLRVLAASRTELASHPGFTPAIRAHLDTLQEALATALAGATTLKERAAQAAEPANVTPTQPVEGVHDRGTLKRQVAQVVQILEDALANTRELDSPAGLRHLLEDEHAAEQLAAEARRVEEAAAAEAVWAVLPETITQLESTRQSLLVSLRSALGYATAVESYSPERAQELYGLLDETLAVTVSLPGLHASTLADVLHAERAWHEFATSVATRRLSVRQAELTSQGLTLLFGPAGRLSESISELTDIAAREPLRSYKQQAHTRRRLLATVHDLEESLHQELDSLAQHRLTSTGGAGSVDRLIAEANRDEQELGRIQAALGQARFRLRSTEGSSLDTAKPMLTALDIELGALEEDIAAFQARGRARGRATAAATSSQSATRHRLREKLQGLLTEPMSQGTNESTRIDTTTTPAVEKLEEASSSAELAIRPDPQSETAQAIMIRRGDD